MSGDYSRKTFKAKHNYSGVLMQQGRVQLDADWNEQLAINSRRQRAQTVDTIGRIVVPMETPDGFKIAFGAAGLKIFPGRMYVDGLLAENHGANPPEFYPVLDEERGSEPLLYHTQPYFPNAAELAPLPTTGTGIAYLDVWQREVTYVKQPGLVEPAVGVDTTARWQTVWQVKILTVDTAENEGLGCTDQVDAWDKLVAPSAGRLTTKIVDSQDDENPCLVPTEGGYRALENRLYRVEVHTGGGFDTATFKWSRHNASIESAVHQISGTELTVAQSQWDAIRRFNVGDWVEITDNVREFSGLAGEMRQVTEVDYAQNIITLTSGLPASDFPTDVNNASLPDRHTRILRWDQKNDVDLISGLVTITNQSVYLEDGIQIGFTIDSSPALNGEFKTADYWLFYARSATASIELLDQAPPQGIHHHYARLAILNFPDQQDDCRIHWPPKFGTSCCCTITVGDGKTSHGQYNTIQEAIKQLPIDGGKICVLPGYYPEHIVISGKRNIVISGCGSFSRVTSREGGDYTNTPVISIDNSQHIHIENLSIFANQQGEGVFINKTFDEQLLRAKRKEHFGSELNLRHITLENLYINSGTGSGIRCENGSHIVIQDNVIQMRDVQSPWPGIFMVGTDVLITNNTVTVVAEQVMIKSARPMDTIADFAAARLAIPGRNMVARGGIQLGGMSERIKLLNNYISKGIGDGITLGSLSIVDEKDAPVIKYIALFANSKLQCDACEPPSIKITDSPQRIVENPGFNDYELEPGYDQEDIFQKPLKITSAGDLCDIEISHNLIEHMGRNGIGVVGFFDLEKNDEFISIENLSISHNQIEACLNSVLPSIDTRYEDDMGYGGIALADVLNLQIHDNNIVNNGTNPFDPVCGIYVLHGEGVEICDNRIIENGKKANDANKGYKTGPRSGVHLVYAITPTSSISLAGLDNLPRQNGVPAAKIHNNIVVHPVGRALTINALGPVIVSDNQLTSRGAIKGSESTKVSTVSILNLGLSNELYLQITGFSQIVKQRTDLSSLNSNIKNRSAGGVTFIDSGLDDFKLGRYLANGNVMFANNQLVLDELDMISNVIISATSILSMDDISFINNQCDYSLLSDFIVFPNMLLAPSLRISNNRFKESLAGAIFSVLAFGIMNTTTNNQATHCIISRGFPGLEIVKDNIELFDVLLGGGDISICERFKSLIKA